MTEHMRQSPQIRIEYGVRDAFGNVHLVLSAEEAAERVDDDSRPIYGPQPRSVVQRTVLVSRWEPKP